MTDAEFYILIAVGVFITLVAGFVLRPKSKKNKRRKKGRGKKDKFYKPDAYQHMGGDSGDFQDSDMYAMKEGKGSAAFKDDDGPKKKKKDEYESWEDY